MNTLAEKLLRKDTSFTITHHNADTDEAMRRLEDVLLAHPYITADLTAFVFGRPYVDGGRAAFDCRAVYNNNNLLGPVFLIKDPADLQTAVSVAMKLHMQDIRFIFDNRTGKFSYNISKMISNARMASGEDLETGQMNNDGSYSHSFCNSRIIVHNTHFKYFDTPEDVNDASFVLAEEARRIMRRSQSTRDILCNVWHWFDKNVKYVNTDMKSDHSFVSLVRTGEGVCQAIAVCAYRLLSFCGVDVHYVSGMGGSGDDWGGHAWNMVYLEDEWRHIDYTFELHHSASTLIQPEAEFRKKHRWTESTYSTVQMKKIAGVKHYLRSMNILFSVNKPQFKMGNCSVYTFRNEMPCISSDGKTYFAVNIITALYGGCYKQVGNNLELYVGTSYNSVPIADTFRSGNKYYVDAETLRDMRFAVSREGDSVYVEKY